MNTGPLIHLGFCWVFGAEDPLLALERLRACGFEGIELWPRDLRRHGPEKWAAALTATGMQCFQLCPYFNFVHGAEKQRESGAILDEFLSAAQVLNCTRLRAFTEPPWGEGVVGAAAATEEQWQAAICGLREYCDEAGPDVEICLECHAGSLMENSAGALRVLREVQRPNLTVNLQLPLLGEEVTTSIAALGRYTTHIHIHNWATGSESTRTPIYRRRAATGIRCSSTSSTGKDAAFVSRWSTPITEKVRGRPRSSMALTWSSCAAGCSEQAGQKQT
jgi:sugar phosphate isomerase/epimerase